VQDHWNRLYASNPVQQLGWYEETPEPSLRLLAKCKLGCDDAILDIGAGASTFIDRLIERGFQNIIAADLSETALAHLQVRLGQGRAAQVKWIVDDVTRPTRLMKLGEITLWHDRALLHFLLDDNQRQAYLATLKNVVRPGGYVILAAFSLQGAHRCAGLDVRNYDQTMLAEFLGQEFEILEWFEHVYHMPSGDPRPYIYTCFQRNAAG
jgi:SAM-dependent methyltransferase